MKIMSDIEDEVEGRKARILSVAGEGTDNPDIRSAFIEKTVGGMVAQLYKIDISIKTKIALQAKKASGERVGYILSVSSSQKETASKKTRSNKPSLPRSKNCAQKVSASARSHLS